MAYNTKAIKTDVNGNPISQYYNPNTDEYEPVEGAGGGNKVILYNEDGTPNNSLSLQEILDKLDQLKGTVIDEETRKQNEQIRQQNEQQRIDLYNALKDLDVSQYELRLQKLEYDTSVEEFILEEAYGPIIPLPSNATNGQINEIKIFGNTEAEEDNVKSTFGAIRLKSVNEDETKESTLYVLGKDEEGNILELRSLPNGTKDEINVAERKAIIKTKKIILDGSENWREFTATYADSNGFYRMRIDGWVTQNKAVAGFDTGLAWNDLATFRIVTRIAEGGLPNLIAFHENGSLYLSLPRDYIDANYSPTLDGMKQYLNDHPITLIYQLAEPIEIPIEVFGSLQSYENGTVYVETIIPRVDFYTPEGIELEGPPEKEPRIKEIDSLYLVDRENGLLIPLDISKAIIEDIALRHPDLVGGALVVWDYIPDVESTNPTILMKLPTNLKASLTSTLQGVQELSNKTKKLDTRVIANRRDIYNLQDNFATLQSDVFGISNEFDAHLSENSGKHITESGENVNGRYIKFDDGTMIVYMTNISIIGNDDSYAQIPVPFPHLFNEIPVVFSVPKNRRRISTGEGATTKYFNAIPVNVSGSQISTLRFMYGDSSNLGSDYEFIVDVIAIGRWK